MTGAKTFARQRPCTCSHADSFWIDVDLGRPTLACKDVMKLSESEKHVLIYKLRQRMTAA
jgi:hypothetical protein